VSEYLVEGFNEVVFLSFKTCHVREAFFFFFLWQFFCNFVGNILEDTKFSYFFLKKICHEMNFLLLKSCHNCLQNDNVLKIFLLSHFEYCQIWLYIYIYILMDDGHLSNNSKLKK
jgi:hypothetical protein